jgi:DNA invertase Pin-like site-specific DNA recombinase
MALFGYSRVSTDGQSLTAQVAELKAADCTRIFKEKISGSKSDRRQLNRLLAELDQGDVLGCDPARSLGAVYSGSS